jgi:hypothetical protein
VDLGSFADADGNPDLGTMAMYGGRLFVQVRRLNSEAPAGMQGPFYLAVVDPARQRLVDVDSEAPGVQAIPLQGTSPKHRMQVLAKPRKLFVSATGGFFDAGGLEAIDLRTLRSEGLIVREADGTTGADLGPFLMTAPDRGFVVYSTDLDLSSHLKRFTISGGVEPGLELFVTVGYAVPALALDPKQDNLFVPDGAFGRQGIWVLRASTGQILSSSPVPTDGMPSDLLLATEP